MPKSGHDGCTKQPSYGKDGGKAALCAQHAKDGMVNVVAKRCGHSGCTTRPSYGTVGGKAELCVEHTKDGMVNVVTKRCSHSGCTKHPSYGKVGGTAELCAQHAKNGMVNLKHRKRTSGAVERNSNGLGRAGSPTEGGSSALRVGAGQTTQRGSSSGNSSGTNKRARVGVGVHVAPSSPNNAGAATAGGRVARSGRTTAAGRSSLKPEPIVKTEAQVRISCKAEREPSGAQGAPNRGQGEELGAGGGGEVAVVLEPDTAVKPEVTVTRPAGRKREQTTS